MPQATLLLLPSSIGKHLPCDLKLQEIEWRLRYAQACDALEDLRRHLCIRTHLYQFKDRFVRGQRPNTRARVIVNSVEHKVRTSAARYRTAHGALCMLAPFLDKTGWENIVRQLDDVDIRPMTEGEDGETEGRRSLSWIWRTGSLMSDASNPEQLQEGMIIP